MVFLRCHLVELRAPAHYRALRVHQHHLMRPSSEVEVKKGGIPDVRSHLAWNIKFIVSNMASDNKYDRQLRLWGAAGQVRTRTLLSSWRRTILLTRIRHCAESVDGKQGVFAYGRCDRNRNP